MQKNIRDLLSYRSYRLPQFSSDASNKIAFKVANSIIKTRHFDVNL